MGTRDVNWGVKTMPIFCLAVVDTICIAALYRSLRSSPPRDAKAFAAGFYGLSVFWAQAVLDFKGSGLILQLAVITAMFTLCYLNRLGKLSKAAVAASR